MELGFQPGGIPTRSWSCRAKLPLNRSAPAPPQQLEAFDLPREATAGAAWARTPGPPPAILLHSVR
jgi:hypothetical protein